MKTLFSLTLCITLIIGFQSAAAVVITEIINDSQHQEHQELLEQSQSEKPDSMAVQIHDPSAAANREEMFEEVNFFNKVWMLSNCMRNLIMNSPENYITGEAIAIVLFTFLLGNPGIIAVGNIPQLLPLFFIVSLMANALGTGPISETKAPCRNTQCGCELCKEKTTPLEKALYSVIGAGVTVEVLRNAVTAYCGSGLSFMPIEAKIAFLCFAVPINAYTLANVSIYVTRLVTDIVAALNNKQGAKESLQKRFECLENLSDQDRQAHLKAIRSLERQLFSYNAAQSIKNLGYWLAIPAVAITGAAMVSGGYWVYQEIGSGVAYLAGSYPELSTALLTGLHVGGSLLLLPHGAGLGLMGIGGTVLLIKNFANRCQTEEEKRLNHPVLRKNLKRAGWILSTFTVGGACLYCLYNEWALNCLDAHNTQDWIPANLSETALNELNTILPNANITSVEGLQEYLYNNPDGYSIKTCLLLSPTFTTENIAKGILFPITYALSVYSGGGSIEDSALATIAFKNNVQKCLCPSPTDQTVNDIQLPRINPSVINNNGSNTEAAAQAECHMLLLAPQTIPDENNHKSNSASSSVLLLLPTVSPPSGEKRDEHEIYLTPEFQSAIEELRNFPN